MSPNNCPFKCISLPSCLSAQSQHSKVTLSAEKKWPRRKKEWLSIQLHLQKSHNDHFQQHCLALVFIKWLYTFSILDMDETVRSRPSTLCMLLQIKSMSSMSEPSMRKHWETRQHRFYFDGSSRLIFSANSLFERGSNKAAILPHALKSLSFQRSFVRPSILHMWATCTIWMLDVAVVFSSLTISPLSFSALSTPPEASSVGSRSRGLGRSGTHWRVNVSVAKAPAEARNLHNFDWHLQNFAVFFRPSGEGGSNSHSSE